MREMNIRRNAMKKPCTDCPHNRKIHIRTRDGSRGSVWHNCMLFGGYYQKVANCVEYAEYLAWQRVNRKKLKDESERNNIKAKDC